MCGQGTIGKIKLLSHFLEMLWSDDSTHMCKFKKTRFWIQDISKHVNEMKNRHRKF